MALVLVVEAVAVEVVPVELLPLELEPLAVELLLPELLQPPVLPEFEIAAGVLLPVVESSACTIAAMEAIPIAKTSAVAKPQSGCTSNFEFRISFELRTSNFEFTASLGFT